MAPPENHWKVYIIQSSDSKLYTGITTDMEKRWQQHLEGKGAKFFSGRKPSSLRYMESGHNRSTALKREAAIKKLRRSEKLDLIDSAQNEIKAE
jgi:putative endonuclease